MTGMRDSAAGRSESRPLVATPEILIEQARSLSVDAARFVRYKPPHVLASHWYRHGAKLYREAAEFLEKAAAKIDAEEGTARAAESDLPPSPEAAAPVPLGFGVVLHETEAEKMGRDHARAFDVEIPHDERGDE